VARPISFRKALREWGLYLFVLPALLMIVLFAYAPTGSAVYHSFFDWEGGDYKRLVGLENFRRALQDTVFWKSFVTVGILLAANLVKMIPAILIAVLIHRLRSARWRYAYRVLVVLPMIVPGLVMLFIWKFFFDPNYGILNKFLDATGLKAALVGIDQVFGWEVFQAGVPIAWLSTPDLVLPSLILWGFPWLGVVGVLVFLAGLQNIDKEIYEAAQLDGISSASMFFRIELPLIMTQIRLMLVLVIIGTLQQFGLQLLLLGDNGGPEQRGLVPGLWMYNRAFSVGEFGYACALGLILFAVILVLTLINNRFMRVEK